MYDADRAKLIEIVRQDPFANALGIELLELREGYAQVAMTLRPDMLNFHGMPHGGAIFALADFAFSAAGNSRGQVGVAMEVTITYLNVAPHGARLIAEAQEEYLGRRTGTYHLTVATEDGQLIASCHALLWRKGERFGKDIVAP